MLLTKPQQQRFWREWSAVVRHQGWQESRDEIEARRHALLANCGFNSLTQVDRAAGFDKVLAALGELQDKIAPTIETDHPELGERRRLTWQVGNLVAQLGRPYAERIMTDRFGHNRLDDLSQHQLEQLRNTLNARLHAKRKAGRPASAELATSNTPF